MKLRQKRIAVVMLSALCALSATTAVTAFSVKQADAATIVDPTRFEMLDGASIRLASPKGLRFIAEMGSEVYADIMKEESGVEKKMGMYIMPYSYLSDSAMYSDGETGVAEENYQNITKKIDHVFYDSANAEVKNKIYQKGNYYYANGVIGDLYLHNYDTDFIGIAYVAETTSEGTTYSFAQFDEENNVRDSLYVAIEAYEDYTAQEARDVFNEYVLGAHLESLGMAETVTESGRVYTYDGAEYSTVGEAVKANCDLSLTLDQSTLILGSDENAATLTATVVSKGEAVSVDTHADWSSSDTGVVTVDEKGLVKAVSAGSAKVTASIMGKTATCNVYVSDMAKDTTEWMIENNVTASGYQSVDAGRKIVLSPSTHNGAENVPMHNPNVTSTYTPSVSFNGDYGIGDYAVFDFTGGNMPIVAFFQDENATTPFNIARTTDTASKGLVFLNGLYMPNGSIYGAGGSLANRLSVMGPYGLVSIEADIADVQLRHTISNGQWPGAENLAKTSNHYRMIIGYSAGTATGYTVRVCVYNLDTGAAYEFSESAGTKDYGITLPNNYFSGKIALYSQFGKTTTLDKIYPVQEDTTFDAVKAKYCNTYTEWMQENGVSAANYSSLGEDQKIVLNASTHNGAETVPAYNTNVTETTMSYVAFNGNYGINDFAVVDFTGNNAPMVAFFQDASATTPFNHTRRASTATKGMVFMNGLYRPDGVIQGTGGALATRLSCLGPYGFASIDADVAGVQYRHTLANGSAYSVGGLADSTTRYRLIVGFTAGTTTSYTIRVCFINLDTGEQWEISESAGTKNYDGVTLPEDYFSGKIALYGQFGKTTTLDKVYAIEEDTTFGRVKGKYAYQAPIEEPETPEVPVDTRPEWMQEGNISADNYQSVSEDGQVVLNASTHNGAVSEAAHSTNVTESDMSYVSFDGNYGVGDYAVFDFTGNNMPIIAFFQDEDATTPFNHARTASAETKGLVFTNGLYYPNGVMHGIGGALPTRISVVGPYGFANIDGDVDGVQYRHTIANNSPYGIGNLYQSNTRYRMIIGFSSVSLTGYTVRVHILNLDDGTYYDFSESAGTMTYTDIQLPYNYFSGKIALYGQFGKTTALDKVYPIEEDTTFVAVKTKYAYNPTWAEENNISFKNSASVLEEGTVVLNASTHNGADSAGGWTATESNMSYVAFNGNYGVNDYAVFDFTGNNMPIVAFFQDENATTPFNHARTADLQNKGLVFTNGHRVPSGAIYGATGAWGSRLSVWGPYGFANLDAAVDGVQPYQTIANGASCGIVNLSSSAHYRMIIGYSQGTVNGSTTTFTLRVYVLNLDDGSSYTFSESAGTKSYSNITLSEDYFSGKIALYGQFGAKTVLNKVYPIEEDTAFNDVVSKYAKNYDYSKYTNSFDAYAYTGPTDGTYTIDGTVTDTGTDHRISGLADYKAAGFNIYLAQSSIIIDHNTTAESFEADYGDIMRAADEAGLKVILTDTRIQNLSEPFTVSYDSSNNIVVTDNKTWWANADGTQLRYQSDASLDTAIASWMSIYKDYPAFYGIMLGDEPTYHNAEYYGRIYKSVKRVMPECFIQYNLFPLQTDETAVEARFPAVDGLTGTAEEQAVARYEAYLRLFIEATGADYVQYDDYPMRSAEEGFWIWTETKPHVSSTYLRSLQVAAKIAKELDIDVNIVAQTFSMESNGTLAIRAISEADARWINNTLLGFGVKQISYYTYFTKQVSETDGEYFIDGASFVNHDGTKTDLYYFMQEIIAENQTFAPTILNFDYVGSKYYEGSSSTYDNSHVDLMDNSHTFTKVSAVSVNTDAAVVTELYDNENYNYMYMVMNAIDTSNTSGTAQTITVTFTGCTKVIVYVNGVATTQSLSSGTYTVTLNAGEAVYLLPY